MKNLIKKIFQSFLAHSHKQNDCPRTFLSLMCKIHVLFCTSLPKKLKAAASSMYLSRSVAGVLRYVHGIYMALIIDNWINDLSMTTTAEWIWLEDLSWHMQLNAFLLLYTIVISTQILNTTRCFFRAALQRSSVSWN